MSTDRFQKDQVGGGGGGPEDPPPYWWRVEQEPTQTGTPFCEDLELLQASDLVDDTDETWPSGKLPLSADLR